MCAHIAGIPCPPVNDTLYLSTGLAPLVMPEPCGHPVAKLVSSSQTSLAMYVIVAQSAASK